MPQTQPIVTPIKCACGKQVGTMTTAHPPHASLVLQVYCSTCGAGRATRERTK